MGERGNCETCRELLSAALDLCVRARKLDAHERTNVQAEMFAGSSEMLAGRAATHNLMFPDQPMFTKSATIPLWVQDQYEKDLAEWERKARGHLMQGCRPSPSQGSDQHQSGK